MPTYALTEFFFKGQKYAFHSAKPGQRPPKCAHCSVCGMHVTAKNARAPGRKLVCKGCYEKGLTKICVRCNEPIFTEAYPSLYGNMTDCGRVYFHPEHFVCVNGHPLHMGDRARFDAGVLRCSECANEYVLTCPHCKQSGKDHAHLGQMACGVFYHTKCLGCQFCKVGVATEPWVEVRGKPCCMLCKKLKMEEGLLDDRGRPIPGKDWPMASTLVQTGPQKKTR
jgi:hypothetical protein